MKEKILPTVIIIIQIMAAMPFLLKLDWRMSLYWLCAAGINIAVTY